MVPNDPLDWFPSANALLRFPDDRDWFPWFPFKGGEPGTSSHRFPGISGNWSEPVASQRPAVPSRKLTAALIVRST
jgi:hypothetical protein